MQIWGQGENDDVSLWLPETEQLFKNEWMGNELLPMGMFALNVTVYNTKIKSFAIT